MATATNEKPEPVQELLEVAQIQAEASAWFLRYLAEGKLDDASVFAGIMSKCCEVRAQLLARLATGEGAADVPVVNQAVH
jgi:hypothetical protein